MKSAPGRFIPPQDVISPGTAGKIRSFSRWIHDFAWIFSGSESASGSIHDSDFACDYFFEKPKTVLQWVSHVQEVPVQSEEDYGVQLRALHDTLFAPLDVDSPNPTAQIQKLRGSASAESGSLLSVNERLQVVVSLCDILTTANTEREHRETQLRETRSKVRDSLRQGSEESSLDRERQRKFFESAIIRKWNEYVPAARPQSERLLVRLRVSAVEGSR